MRVLWITNIMMPPVCEALSISVPAVGGWMFSSLKRLCNLPDVELAVATVWQNKNFEHRNIDGIDYFLLPLNGKPMTRYNAHLEYHWKEVRNRFNPDIVHIHGSEFPHGLAYVRACGNDGVAVSIQGIISAYSRYYSLDGDGVRHLTSFRDFLKGGIKAEQKDFARRGEYEKELFKSVKHIIGRTEWDKAHTWAINPDATYHHVGETLRDSFYQRKWAYEGCEPHSIFVSQAGYPIKGLHKLLQAMPLVLRNYPDAMVYVAGGDPTSAPWYRITGYGQYLRKLIRDNDLCEHVVFTGSLSEERMCERYLRSNLFVCCSAIENSPNSLGEAQLLGMPHLASFVGGVPEIVAYDPEVLYRYEETEMLARRICAIFEAGVDARCHDFDKLRYDAVSNCMHLCDAYKIMLQS